MGFNVYYYVRQLPMEELFTIWLIIMISDIVIIVVQFPNISRDNLIFIVILYLYLFSTTFFREMKCFEQC